MYRYLRQLQLDFSIALAVAEKQDKSTVETDEPTELQRLAALLEDMKDDVKNAQERIKDARYDRDLIDVFEGCISHKVKTA